MLKQLGIALVLALGLQTFVQAQDMPAFSLRLGYSPLTQDQLGIGFGLRPGQGRFLHQFELYPLQNRRSSIVNKPFNLGFLWRSSVVLNKTESRFQALAGAEFYGYHYSREILGSTPPDARYQDWVGQFMLQLGCNYRIGQRVHLNLSLPILGFESGHFTDGDLGESSRFTPVFIGFMGFFQPKIGLEVGLF